MWSNMFRAFRSGCKPAKEPKRIPKYPKTEPAGTKKRATERSAFCHPLLGGDGLPFWALRGLFERRSAGSKKKVTERAPFRHPLFAAGGFPFWVF